METNTVRVIACKGFKHVISFKFVTQNKNNRTQKARGQCNTVISSIEAQRGIQKSTCFVEKVGIGLGQVRVDDVTIWVAKVVI
jgi:hypothetical protein